MRAPGGDFNDDPTVARPKHERPASTTVVFELVVTDGPDAGKRFTIDEGGPGRTLLGKSPACEVRLSDPRVSRRHAALLQSGARLRVTDLGSTNGTFVDGLAIEDAWLRGGEMLLVGDTRLRVAVIEAGRKADPPEVDRFGRMLGASIAMRKLYPLCERLAQSRVPVVIEGETGTGKEQLAEALHEQGPRADAPFVVLDCTAVAPTLIESELFGHEKGAFTGSTHAHRGIFERAHGGTLLIDEIGDMPLELQAKLLRAIERSTITRVGGDRAIQVDVRLLAATRRDLDHEVQCNRFRDDLFHRLAVARIELPPLRARKGDVTMLARHFWSELGGDPGLLTADLLRYWEDWPWPGNVRELRNAVARRIALGDLVDEPVPSTDRVEVHAGERSQGDAIARVLALDLPLADARERLLEEFERRYIERVLAQHGGNVTRAAAAAGVARRHLQRLKSR